MQQTVHIVGSPGIFVDHRTPDHKFSKPVVLVHGAFGAYLVMDKIAEELAERGFECYTPSLRGHKPSEPVDLAAVRLHDYVTDIETVVSELGLHNPVLLGHSMGGLIAFLYASTHNVAAVVGLDPALPPEFWQPEVDAKEVSKLPPVLLWSHLKHPGEGYADAIDALEDIRGDDLVQIFEFRDYPESKKALMDIISGVSVKVDTLKGIPMLLFGVEHDHATHFSIPRDKIRKMAEYCGADFREVKGATHPGIVLGRHAYEVADIVADWLRGL